MNVTAVEVNEWDKDGTVVKVTNVTFDDGSKAPGYDLPSQPEVGKPLPEGWEIATSKAGKPYIKVPKPGGKGGFGGGPASYRNTKEGQAAEQESIHRSVALTQAIALLNSPKGPAAPWNVVAQQMYEWLSKPAGAASVGVAAASAAQPAGVGSRPAQTPETASPGNGPVERPAPAGTSQDHTASSSAPSSEEGEGFGKASLPSSGACEHLRLIAEKPDGSALPKGFVRCLNCGAIFKEKR